MFTASPVTSVGPASGSPTATSPVWITGPRRRSRTPNSSRNSSFSAASRSRISAARTYGAQRVVLVDPRDTEDGHHGIADELLDRPAVALQHIPHRVEVPAHEAADGLGIETLADRGGAGDVGEEDRDGLPGRSSVASAGVSGDPHAWQKRAALEVRLTTARTRMHDASVGRAPSPSRGGVLPERRASMSRVRLTDERPLDAGDQPPLLLEPLP